MRAEVKEVGGFVIAQGELPITVYALRVFDAHNPGHAVVIARASSGRGEPQWIGRAASAICEQRPATVDGAIRIMRQHRAQRRAHGRAHGKAA